MVEVADIGGAGPRRAGSSERAGRSWGVVGRRTVVVGAVLTAVVAGAAAVSVGRDTADGDQTSVRTGHGGPDEYARHLQLDGGRAGEVAISRSNKIEVWWRGPHAEEWSAPVVVEAGRGRFLVGTNIRAVRSTIAIRATYDTRAPWSDAEAGDEPSVATNVFIVCRAGSCTSSDHYEHLAEPPCRRGSCLVSRPEGSMTPVPALTRDGGQVYFGSTERGYVVWSRGRGLRELQSENLPSHGVLGETMMAQDGSLRVVSGQRAGDLCRLTLLTSAPIADLEGTLALTDHLSTETATATGDCATTLEAFTSDQLLVHTDREEPAFLVRRGQTWHPTAEDPTGLVRYVPRPGRHAAGTLTRTGHWHRREVAIGSPDGRRLVAQVHFDGEARWTAPVTVAVAPRGLDCFEIAPTSTPGQDPFYVSLRCRYRPSPGAELVYVGEHAVTDDGHTWASAFGDQLPTRTGTDLYFGGDPAHRWTPTGGLARVGPPVPANSNTFQVDDDTLVLVQAEPVGSRCRLVVRVAGASDERWSGPLPNPDPLVPAGQPCRPVGQYDDRGSVLLYFHYTKADWLPASVTRRQGEWTVTARRRPG